MIKKLAFTLLVFGLPILTLACIKEDLLDMQRVWNSQNITNYSYVVEKQCFCSPDYTKEMQVFVIDGKVVQAKYLDTQKSVPNEVVNQLSSITQWFDVISMSIDDQFDEVAVIYDNEFGYPEKIKIDPHKRRSDDEFSVTISNLAIQ